jgi:uncharacterized protein YecE (DUF72 family)
MPKPTAAGRPIDLRVGCAGWSIARAQQPLFDEGASMLARYATRFDAAEINSSFHRPHQPAIYERWASAVPPRFRFVVKLPKTISHTARLRNTSALLDVFLEQAQGLGDRLGCLLLQLPPSLVFDARVANTFFGVLRRRYSGDMLCEPRHASWFDDKLDALWQRYDLARVVADPSPMSADPRSGGSANVRYWRLHGSPRTYYSRYDDDALHALVADVSARTPAGARAWVIFDNTAHGHAMTDALRFRTMMAEKT